VNTFAVVSFLNELPSLLLQLSLWDLVGAAAYTFMFALFESLGLFLVVFVLTVLVRVLVPRLRTRNFVLLGTLCVLIVMSSGLLVVILGLNQSSLWFQVGMGLLVVGTLIYFVLRYPRFARVWVDLVERISIFGGFYTFLGFSSLIVVFVRNVI
jgi:type IV secretory pathway TrbD component